MKVRSTAAALLAAAATVLATVSAGPAATAAAPEQDWLHVEGNRIVDEAGNQVWLTGANWFGFNATERVFHGLWSGNITEISKAMADRGINIVRIPISTQLLLEWKAGQTATPNVNTYANPELAGKNNLQVFDYFLELCERFGMKVMIDVHSAEADNSGHIHPVWWKGSITTEDFYQAWEWVTARYKDNDTVVAMDVKNEPHGTPTQPPRAKWDSTTDADNFKHVCETAGKRILAINPKVLILCEGVEVYPRPGETWSSPNTDPDLSPNYFYTWWGGNLRGVAEHPVNLGANQDQLVYSPHDYGPLVFDQPWFQKPFDKESLIVDVWGPNWLYIHEQEIAPLLIGEWGGRLGQDERQDRWMTALRDLIVDEGLHQTFWVLNPNSGDTGGLLLDDWRTWDEQKYALLKPALWQHNGKFVSLDHQVRLGGAGSTTGISLGERYSGSGPVDTTAPSVPSGLTAGAVTSSSISLSWNASTDNVGVSGYEVYRGTTRVATVAGTSYTDSGLTANTAYSYTVRARDAAGNVSAASAALSARTSSGGSGSSGCTATLRAVNSWQGGFQAEVTVANTGATAIRGWTVDLAVASGSAISSLWNGTLTGSRVTNAAHNGALGASASTTFGFVGTGQAAGVTVAGCTGS
ncbi:cellulase family glycosylhydrolase [Actinokineospora sp. UTMC 2448]|uniref:cellulase family glycosylhydrolase n=1 Tax=Actinokineospora sp. UTMC 2448 TaxID=2268449 RepID=UPI00220BEA18|nr:cellulase family glycosylhydrolase [Actinokineospora sp. UTMC 2448]UVS76713.1 Endoglucanase E1 precursor [Actinokineospora sp. UTMC 2448]